MSTAYHLIRDIVFLAIGAFLFIGALHPGLFDPNNTQAAVARGDLRQMEEV